MSDRSKAKVAFLDQTSWAEWAQSPIAQDASARSYTRLSHKGESVILMDAAPEAGEDVGPFIRITKELQKMQLAPPRILARDDGQGFLILEDLGNTDFAKAIHANPACAIELYRAAADVLIHISQQAAPNLHALDAATAGDMVRITAEHYAQTPALADDLSASITTMFQDHCQATPTLALRDFHAENLIWRPDRTGLQRVGLLDFQDAFIAPDGYDLASLLRDARRDIDANLADNILGYVADQTGEPHDQLTLRIRGLAIQRNLRILGVFARLIRVHGKTRYAAMLPRVWRYINEDLDHPAFSDLHKLVSDGLPAPSAFEAST